MGGPSAWGLGELLTIRPLERSCSETLTCGMIPLEDAFECGNEPSGSVK